MQISNFGRPEHRLISAAVEKALSQVAAEFGVNFSIGGGQVGTTKGFIKLEVEVVPKVGEMSHAEKEWRGYAHYFGLNPDGFGKTVLVQRKPYKICGLKPSAPKFNVLAECVVTGKIYKLTATSIASQIAMKVAA